MIKITALNELPSSDSEDEDVNTITKEAQEQIALNEYNRALELMHKNEKEDALSIFKDLLETELLDQVQKQQIPADGRSRPMLSLKYSCYKNIGNLQAQLENYEDAIQNYLEAANLDNSDVMLWYNMGMLACKTSSLEMASSAFKQGLKCNPNHWPCLDSIITVLYAIPDYMNCLLYISLALERDSSYIKGLALRKKIFDDVPFIEESYKLYNSNWKLDPPLDTEFDQVSGEKMLSEAKVIAENWIEACKPEFETKSVPDLELRKSLTKYTWLELGQCLVDLHEYITENNASFVSRVDLVVKLKAEEKLITMKNILKNINVSNGDVVINHEQNANWNDDDKMNVDNVDGFSMEDKDNLNEDINFDNNGHKFEIIPEGTDDIESCTNNIVIITGNTFLKESRNLEKGEGIEEDNDGKVNYVSNEEDSAKNHHKSNEIASEKSNKGEDEKSNGKENNKKYKGQKVKKRRRSSLCQLNQWPSGWSSTSLKRSLRARGNNRKDCERDDGLLEEELRRLLPPSLLPDTIKFREQETRIADESMDTMDMYNLFFQKENNSNGTCSGKSSDGSRPPSPFTNEYENYFDSDQEKLDVEEFVKQHGKNNFMIIIAKFTEFVCTKWRYKWPEGLSEVFLLSYTFTREYIPHPSPFGESIDDCILQLDAQMTLLFCELFTDKWLTRKPSYRPISSPDKLGIGIPAEELGYIIFASVRDNLYTEEDIFYLFRVLWLKANIYFCQGDTDISIETLELLLHRMEMLESESGKASLKLINCRHNSCINVQTVKKMLISIRRGQKLREVKTLYKEKKYAELSCILQDTFKFAKQSNAFFCSDVDVDRVQHQSILLDSLWQLHQYEDCYVWAEACLHESWNSYVTALNPYAEESDRKKWIKSILGALEKLDACVGEVSTFVVKYLPEGRQTRLVQNLVHIIRHQLDVLESSKNMPIETVLPWILLHYIIMHEEDKERAKGSPVKSKSQNSNGESEDEDDDIPSSISILLVSHEFLGRQGWCCVNQGQLLMFIMKLIIPKLRIPLYSAIKDKLKRHMEQIFYCLYGHPGKFSAGSAKTRLKHLDEHSARHMELTWEAAQLLFEFYKPSIVPAFDTKKDSTSLDTVNLFKKIGQLVPAESNPNTVWDKMNAYILDKQDKMPTVATPIHSEISLIYYLIADYYFKTGSWENAIHYYTLDLCLHPNELNSWVGLAMATGTIMETWLKHCSPKVTERSYLTNAKIAQRSYQHAIELSPSHLVIWTEYGNFAYAVHSYCSRLLKQESDSLSMERFQFLETRKDEMLETANHCFGSANSIYIAYQDIEETQDERWLYQYMLAKVSEKRNEDPPVFLKHYATASQLLFQNNAEYPSRISGHKIQPHLAIEALEVYYRIHASILKYLEQHEGKPLKKSLGIVFQEHLKGCRQGPFMVKKSSAQKKEDAWDTGNSKPATKEPAVKEQNDANVSAPVKLARASSSVEEIEVIKITDNGPGNLSAENKSDSRKRANENPSPPNSKKIKFADQSDEVPEEIMILSSDDEPSPRKSGPSDIRLQDPLCLDNFTNSLDKETNVQDYMDALMRQQIESSNEKDLSITDDDEARKPEGVWLQNDDFKDKDASSEKQEDKKNVQVSKRRGSHDSTTTNQTSSTGTNNSSCSSSDSSSSDESSSSSSSDSESESGDSDGEKKKKDTDAEDKAFLTEEETNALVESCLTGLEQCNLRFAEHFKSIYRMAHFFFNSKAAKSISKCKQLLLDSYKCQFHQGQTIQGLFKERKSTNFFHGIWRIPVHEIDRAGSFAFHMSRCVMLLMQVLKETNDSQMLSELYVQLSKTPDFEKRYLGDQEREQLSQQALTLCVQSIRSKMQRMNANGADTENKITALIDIYRIYEHVKSSSQNQSKPDASLKTFKSLLKDAYKIYPGNTSTEGNIFHLAANFCRAQIRNRNAKVLPAPSTTSILPIPTTTIATNHTPMVAIPGSAVASSLVQPRKTTKSSATGRPRGRPPNTNKYSQNMPRNAEFFNQMRAKSGFSNYLPTQGNPLFNPSFRNPFLDTNMLGSILAPGLDPKVIEQAMQYFTQMEVCKNAIRQYQAISNLAGMNAPSGSGSNVPKPDNLSAMRSSGMGNVMTQQNKVHATSSNVPTSFTKNPVTQGSNKASVSIPTSKDRPDISITPVKGDNASSKLKLPKNPLQNDPLGIQLTNSVQITPANKTSTHPPATQVSLLRPTTAQSNKNPSSKQAPKSQIRVAKLPQEPPKVTNVPMAHSSFIPNAGMTASSLLQFNRGTESVTIQPAMQNVPRNMNSSSLQHKLLSKKQTQHRPMTQPQSLSPRPTLPTNSVQLTKKRKLTPSANKPTIPHGSQDSLNIMPISSKPKPSFLNTELSGISFSPIIPSTQAINMKVGPSKKVAKPQTSALEIAPSPHIHTSAETLSMISQLQQHSHLEIIPQGTQVKQSADIGKSISSGRSMPRKTTDNGKPTNPDFVTVHELNRKKPEVNFSIAPPKRSEKPPKDSVEIITLDD